MAGLVLTSGNQIWQRLRVRLLLDHEDVGSVVNDFLVMKILSFPDAQS